MRTIALLLLCSCAPAATAIPSSLPFVRINADLQGAQMSREAAIAIASRRAEDKAKLAKATIDHEAKLRSTEHERDEAVKLAERHSWWGAYGATTVLVAVIAALGLGFGAGYGAAPRK